MTEQKLDASIVRRSFFNTSIADVYRAIDGGSLVGAYTLLLCSLDALANVAADESSGEAACCTTCGQRNTGESQICAECQKPRPSSDAGKIFRQWCDRWIKKEQGQKNCRAQFLYELRCALVHAHGMGKNMKDVYGYQLQHDLPSNHWKEMPVPKSLARHNLRPGYVLNLESLLAEYALAAWMFFAWLEASWEDQQEAIAKRLLNLVGLFALDERNRLYMIGQPPATFGEMHAALKIFDTPDDIAVETVRYQIHEIYKRSTGMCKCNSVYKELVEEHDRKERLLRFDFDKLAAVGKDLHELINEYADELVSEIDFRKRLKGIAKPADNLLNNFPDTEYPLLNVDRDFRASLKSLAFKSKTKQLETLALEAEDYLMDLITALSDMMREAVTHNILHEWKENDLLRSMGVQIRTSF